MMFIFKKAKKKKKKEKKIDNKKIEKNAAYISVTKFGMPAIIKF